MQWTFDNLNDESYLRRVVMPLEVSVQLSEQHLPCPEVTDPRTT